MDIHIYKAMNAKGATEKRPEENLTYCIIKTHLRYLTNHEDQKLVWFNDVNYAKLDIYFQTRNGQKYALRLQGPPHDESQDHDRIQQFYLEERGYIVIDFWYHKMENLFLRNQRLLTNQELYYAFIEIKNKLKDFKLFLKPYNASLIDQSD